MVYTASESTARAVSGRGHPGVAELGGYPRPAVRVGAGVHPAVELLGHQGAVEPGAEPHPHHRRVPVEGDELLGAVEHRLHRPAGLAGQAGHHRLEAGEGLGSEGAAHRRRHHANLLLVDAEHPGQVGAQVERGLGAGVQLEAAVIEPAGALAWGSIGVLGAGRAEGPRSPPQSRPFLHRPARAGSGGRRWCSPEPDPDRHGVPGRRPASGWMSGAPSATADSGSSTAGSSSYSTSTAWTAARASVTVGAPPPRHDVADEAGGSASTSWSLSWQP